MDRHSRLREARACIQTLLVHHFKWVNKAFSVRWAEAKAEHVNGVSCLLVTLGDPSLALPFLTTLVPKETPLAYQRASDMVEGGGRDFLEAIRLELPNGDAVIYSQMLSS